MPCMDVGNLACLAPDPGVWASFVCLLASADGHLLQLLKNNNLSLTFCISQSVLHGEGSPLRKCNDPCTSRRLKGRQTRYQEFDFVSTKPSTVTLLALPDYLPS